VLLDDSLVEYIKCILDVRQPDFEFGYSVFHVYDCC
jgi:hypothetical protein